MEIIKDFKYLDEVEFHEMFKPQQTPNGDLLEFTDVKDLDPRNVWTIVDSGDDGNWYADPGFHVVNKLGYVTSETPWTDDIMVAVYFLDDFDHEEDED